MYVSTGPRPYHVICSSPGATINSIPNRGIIASVRPPGVYAPCTRTSPVPAITYFKV